VTELSTVNWQMTKILATLLVSGSFAS